MEEDKKQNEQNNLGDWRPDYFPTSPKTVFKRSFLLTFFLGALCFSVYQCSEHDGANNTPQGSDNISDQEPVNPFGDQDEDEI